MPTYRFTAIDEEGQTCRGQREAASQTALGALLRREGQWLAEARESTGGNDPPVRRVRGRRVPQRVLEQFFLSLSLQLKAGVNVVTALTFGVDKDTTAGFREVHADVLDRVKSGTPLSEALAAHPRTFSVLVINLVKAGEASGRLGEVCDEVRRHFEWSDRLLGDVKQALIYPITLCFAAASFFFVVFTFFIPRFSGVLRELGVPLPLLTRVMIRVSDFVMQHYFLVGLTLVGPPLLGWLGIRTSAAFAQWVDGVKLRLPLVGPILWQTSLCRLVQNLATLYGAGIPLLDALKLCRPLVGNRRIQEGLAVVHDGVAAGRPLHDTMSRSSLFPPMVVQMTALGESTGTLDQSLQSVANYYNVTVPRAVKKVFTVFEPLMIVALLVVVGTIVLSVFLPIASALDAK